jgi:sulfite reductase (NADPH) hemoprotein beta-component
MHGGTFRLTANQNVIISSVPEAQKQTVNRLLEYYGVNDLQIISPLKQQALACVALPTCGQAMSEAERYLPELTAHVEALLNNHELIDEAISLRITGCPNGCARPYLAEIALVGKAPGRFNLFLGGSADGARLNRLAHENLNETAILDILDQWLGRFAAQRKSGESFGDFVHRHPLVLAEAV